MNECSSPSSCLTTSCTVSATSWTTWGWRTLAFLWASPSPSPVDRPAWTLWVSLSFFLSDTLQRLSLPVKHKSACVWKLWKEWLCFYLTTLFSMSPRIFTWFTQLENFYSRESLWHGQKASRQQTVREKMWWDCWGRPLRGERYDIRRKTEGMKIYAFL